MNEKYLMEKQKSQFRRPTRTPFLYHDEKCQRINAHTIRIQMYKQIQIHAYIHIVGTAICREGAGQRAQ